MFIHNKPQLNFSVTGTIGQLDKDDYQLLSGVTSYVTAHVDDVLCE